MKNENNLSIISVSLDKEATKQFYDLCEQETRGPSAMVKHMLKFYLKNKDKVK